MDASGDAVVDRVRRATPADAPEAALLLHDFNVEFATPSPGPAVLAARLERLLVGEDLAVLLTAVPDQGVTVVSFRPNAWYDGPVALLDELFVRPALRSQGLGAGLLAAAGALAEARGSGLLEINVDEPDTDARRFYEAHGFTGVDADTGERALYYWRELGG